MPNGISSILRPLVVLAMAVATVLGAAGTSQAREQWWEFWDTFDGSTGGAGGPSTQGASPAWVSKTYNLGIAPAAAHNVDCSVGVNLRKVQFTPDQGTPRVNVEVIDPATWTYRTLSTKYVSQLDWTYSQSSVWKPVHTDVVVRLSLLAPGAGKWHAVKIDNLHVWCTY